MATTLEIYYDPLSQPARAVITMCKLANVDFIPKETHLVQQGHRTEEFGQLNPNKKVPIAIDVVNGKKIVMFESSAIMRYICNRYLPADNQFYPRGDKAKIGKIEEMITFHHKHIRPGARAFFSRNFAPLIGMAHMFDVEEETRQAARMAGLAEDIYREKGGALNFVDLTIADILILEEVAQFVYGEVDLEKFPFVTKRLMKMFEKEELKGVHDSFWEHVAGLGFTVPLCWQKFIDPYLEEEDEE